MSSSKNQGLLENLAQSWNGIINYKGQIVSSRRDGVGKSQAIVRPDPQVEAMNWDKPKKGKCICRKND